MKVTKLSHPRSSSIELVFEGTPSDVDFSVQDYFEHYHPVGYGTYIKDVSVTNDHNKRVVVWRAASCD